jgi:hypothetical protein
MRSFESKSIAGRHKAQSHGQGAPGEIRVGAGSQGPLHIFWAHQGNEAKTFDFPEKLRILRKRRAIRQLRKFENDAATKSLPTENREPREIPAVAPAVAALWRGKQKLWRAEHEPRKVSGEPKLKTKRFRVLSASGAATVIGGQHLCV